MILWLGIDFITTNHHHTLPTYGVSVETDQGRGRGGNLLNVLISLEIERNHFTKKV